MSVTVARQGKIIWEEGFGWANVERRIPATENTVHSPASATKLITATVLMILSERGKIDLERPVNSYLGSVKPKAWQRHSSGSYCRSNGVAHGRNAGALSFFLRR
jgi:CubicO group peptidase (beta-lactamase class C family)